MGEVTRAFFSRGFGVPDVLESVGTVDGSGVVSLRDTGELDLERGFGRFSVFGLSVVADDGSGSDTVGRRGLCESRRLRDVSACLSSGVWDAALGDDEGDPGRTVMSESVDASTEHGDNGLAISASRFGGST